MQRHCFSLCAFFGAIAKHINLCHPTLSSLVEKNFFDGDLAVRRCMVSAGQEINNAIVKNIR
jgi:hypothetical protein